MTKQRGMTIIEMVISFAILLLVLGFATALFKQAFTHNTLTQENMSNEQLARVAIANINSSLSQASEDVNPADLTPTPPGNGTPAPPVIGIDTFPTAPAGLATSIAFYRVQSLAPAPSMTVGPAGNPVPSYNVHIISYDAVQQQVDEYVTSVANYQANGPSPAPKVLANNVTDFELQQVAGDKYEYRMSITLNNVLNAATNIQAEQPYTLVDNVHLMR